MTKTDDSVNKENVKYATATLAAAAFMAAAYYLPAETFMGFFAAVLFLIPTAIFVYMLQKIHPTDVNKEE
jgi:hypothetical protein